MANVRRIELDVLDLKGGWPRMSECIAFGIEGKVITKLSLELQIDERMFTEAELQAWQ